MRNRQVRRSCMSDCFERNHSVQGAEFICFLGELESVRLMGFEAIGEAEALCPDLLKVNQAALADYKISSSI